MNPNVAAAVSNVTIHVDTGRWSETVVEDVTLKMANAQVTALLGESGSGKSMLASAIAGALPQGATITEGTISTGSVAYAPHSGATAFASDRSVGDQLRALAPGTDDRLDIAAACRAACYPPDRGHLLPQDHSGGEIQRAALAAALVQSPQLLIVDEPSSSLDDETAFRVWDAISAYSRAGHGVLVITHDVGLMTASKAADQIAIMRCGSIVSAGAAADVMADPNPYVRGFFDTWLSR